MPKTSKYAMALGAVAFVLGTSGVLNAADRYPLSNMGTQRGPTIVVKENTPRKPPTFSAGALIVHNPNGPLKGPPGRETHDSGMGRQQGPTLAMGHGRPPAALHPTATVTRR